MTCGCDSLYGYRLKGHVMATLPERLRHEKNLAARNANRNVPFEEYARNNGLHDSFRGHLEMLDEIRRVYEHWCS